MMGHFGQVTADEYGFTREEMDAYAIESVTRAQRAVSDGSFAEEIAPVTITSRRGEVTVDTDETPGTVNVDKIPDLRPAFRKDGTVTAATSSSISDGAAAVVMMTEAEAAKRGLQTDCPDRRSLGICARARMVHDCAGVRAEETARGTRLDARRCGSLRDQRSFCCRDDGRAHGTSASRTTRPTSTAARARSAIRSARPAAASRSRCCTRSRRAGLRRGIATQCIGGGEATAVAYELL